MRSASWVENFWCGEAIGWSMVCSAWLSAGRLLRYGKKQGVETKNPATFTDAGRVERGEFVDSAQHRPADKYDEKYKQYLAQQNTHLARPDGGDATQDDEIRRSCC